MAIKVSFNGIRTAIPGSYSKTTVLNIGGRPVSDTGIVAILGEAVKGAPGDVEGVQEFNSEQLVDLINKYGSGPIVDAARLLVQPSRDARVQNGAQKVMVWKTNSSTAAELAVQNLDDSAVDVIKLESKNFGVSENLINVSILQGVSADQEASVLSDSAVSFPLTIVDTDGLVVTINGASYTLSLAGTASGTFSQAQTVELLNGEVTNGLTPTWAPEKPCVFEASGTTKIKATLDSSVSPLDKLENRLEYAVMTVDSGSLKATLQLDQVSSINSSTLVVTKGSAGPVRGERGARIVVINRANETEQIAENDNEECFKIRYIGSGSACVMSVSGTSDANKTLTTTCTGQPTHDLNLALANFTTVQDLVSFINAFGGGNKYRCVTSYSKRNSRPAVALDRLSAINIKTLPLGVKCALVEMDEAVNNGSQLVSLVRQDALGQVETISIDAPEFLTGAALGGSTNSDFQEGLDALVGKRVNIVVPLVSQDASVDITEGLTDPDSTYTVDSVNVQVDTHARLASNTKNRSERQAYVSKKASKADTKVAAKALSSEFSTMCFENVSVLDASGTLVEKQPWALAALCAGMQAGTEIGEPTTFKYINAYGISHQDFDPVTDTDEMLDAGVLVVERPASGGFRIVCQNTTYGKDESFVWNRAHVIEAAFFVAYDLRKQLEAIYVGTARQRGSATVKSIFTSVTSILDRYREAGILVADATNGNLGYKDLTVTVNGDIVNVGVTITPAQGVDFILIDLAIDTIRDSITA